MRDLQFDLPLGFHGHGGGFYWVSSEGSTSFFWALTRQRFAAVVAGVPPANVQNCSRHPPSHELWRGRRLPLQFRCERGDTPSVRARHRESSTGLAVNLRRGSKMIDYFGASEFTIFSKRGSPRSGSQ